MGQITDRYQRKIDYLRISITDRCNLRCRYCMPDQGVEAKSHQQILSYEEILEIVKVGMELGIEKVRITGGEPLVRLEVIDFVKSLKKLGLKDIAMTTNAVLLDQFAFDLAEAGLDRVNISLDTLNPAKYRDITRNGELVDVKNGIDAAFKADLTPVKINVVVIDGFNDNEILDFVKLTEEEALHVRFIEYMPIGTDGGYFENGYLPLNKIEEIVRDQHKLIPFKIRGSGPAQQFKLVDGEGSVGFIAAVSHKFCDNCNRFRLTADGNLRPCLASNLEFSFKDKSGSLLEREGILEVFKKAIIKKPEGHNFLEENNFTDGNRNMFQIGG